MSSHFIHMNFKKNHDRYFKKALESNITVDDKTKTKSKSITLVNNSKRQISKITYSFKEIKSFTYKKLINNYNILPYQYNLNQIDNFIKGKYCHSLASFKEIIIFNFSEEFLRKLYKIREIKKKLPLFYEFYKSYLQFFCYPTLSDLNLNELLGKIIEKKAKAFYNENYKEEPIKKEKTMNVVIFTSKIRRELSRKTDLTNLSKTTIMEPNLTNKGSLTSANSIAKIFNEIGNSNKDNNNDILKNKSFNNKNNNKNNNYIKSTKLNNINKRALNIEVNNGNSNNNHIKKIEKFNTNKINALNNRAINSNLNNKTKINLHSENIDSQSKKKALKKKSFQIIKIKNNNKNNNPPSLSTDIKTNGKKTQRELKGPSKFNIIFNKSGNSTSTNISHYNKKNYKKQISRNCISTYADKKNTFTHLKVNNINKLYSSGNNLSNNNNTYSINSFNKENISKTNQPKLLKSSINKTINNKNINNDQFHINTYNKIANLKDKNKKKVSVTNQINSNNARKKLDINKYYTKISLYKNPDSMNKNSNILKELNNNTGEKLLNKINNNLVQKGIAVSNIKTAWNKIDNKYIIHQKKK